MKRSKNTNIKHRYPFKYRGSIFWFIVFLIIFFPIGIILGIKNGALIKDEKILYFSYRGSYGWLIFWAIIFFPISFILILINGVDVVEEPAA
ncbi:MAG: hypothetical protein JSR85_03755 [Proteobacteria bacterium]|nr:hypothetical protein [Pseudomonadota bacterium]